MGHYSILQNVEPFMCFSPNSTNMCNFPQLVNLLPAPCKLNKHPEDVARLAAIKLNRNEW